MTDTTHVTTKHFKGLNIHCKREGLDGLGNVCVGTIFRPTNLLISTLTVAFLTGFQSFSVPFVKRSLIKVYFSA